MKRVGVRELKVRATGLLASGETLVVERHGKPIGFFIPIVAKDRAKGKRPWNASTHWSRTYLPRAG